MRYSEFENIITAPRMGRYCQACGNNTKKAMTLYRLNLLLSQELFTIISCYEVSLRNGIDRHYTTLHGHNWLAYSAIPGGIFDNYNCRHTRNIINNAVNKLGTHFTPGKLLAEMDFGFWRYLYAQPQFFAGGQYLLHVFPYKPVTTPAVQYNHTFIFNELKQINDLRNRIAHHEPICFVIGQAVKDTTYARRHYNLILQLFRWMGIDEAALLYGLDHITNVCDKIDAL